MNKICLFVLLLFLVSCDPDDPGYEFEYETIVTVVPVNLEGINSEYDDYNSALPFPAARFGIYFSSNRASLGDNFDIIHKNLDISYHGDDDILNIAYTNDNLSRYQSKLLPLITSSEDELGPYSHYGPDGIDYFFYSSDEGGDFDIKFVWNHRGSFGSYQASEVISGPYNVELINSDKDDLYPTINQGRTELYFCSNRHAEVFNIYKSTLADEGLLYDSLITSDASIISLDTILSSSSNDKCPSIHQDLLVFTSDREGGYGGYDLYFSKFVGGQWSLPINFGEQINSSYDEYRPITFANFVDTKFMIFSSNRPEGKGGFDLYAVKFKDISE